MRGTLTEKILKNRWIHCSDATWTIPVDQTLTQDSTGTMVYLQLAAINPSKLKTDLSVAYIDHNMLQSGFENADDHAFIASAAKRYGIVYSKPGNGICHQLHLECHAVPGKILIGSDSHTPTCGGIGMLAFGAGGLDVALGMAEGTYTIPAPKLVGIELKGRLRDWVTAKDVVLEVLKRLTVSGGTGRILEYFGEGVASLSVPARATITNMGAELGATTSIFPSDAQTAAFMDLCGRGADFRPLSPDTDAAYDERHVIELDKLVPLAAAPHSPDRIIEVAAEVGLKVDQVAIGSCTNASYDDLMRVAHMLKGKRVHPEVSLVISPGSSGILTMMAQNGALADLIAAGARILEAGCGPCIGMGQAPKTGGISLRTFNRNFKGRSGTASAEVYLVSPETAAASALAGVLTDPRILGDYPQVTPPTAFLKTESLWVWPAPLTDEGSWPTMDTRPQLVMGPNIQPFPRGKSLERTLSAQVALKVGDGITTDHIMPSHAALLPFRSNIPKLSAHCFEGVDPAFPSRCAEIENSIIIGGETYGQGSSREHAALVPLYLGVRAVIAKSFARIHKANLINAGILPLVFEKPSDYDAIDLGAEIRIQAAHEGLDKGWVHLEIVQDGRSWETRVIFDGTQRERDMLLAGGALAIKRQELGGGK